MGRKLSPHHRVAVKTQKSDIHIRKYLEQTKTLRKICNMEGRTVQMTKIVLSHFSESFRQLIEYEFNEQNATNSMTILSGQQYIQAR